MKTLHIANTHFERELNYMPDVLPLLQEIESHPISAQLQFLPLLYAPSGDGVLVSGLPDAQFLRTLEKLRGALPTLVTTDHISNYEALAPWGASPATRALAEIHGLKYNAPQPAVVHCLQSRSFLLETGKTVPRSTLLKDRRELVHVHAEHRRGGVLKRLYSSSGRGLLIFTENTPLEKLEKFMGAGQVICQPWLEKELDFSSLWHIDEGGDIHFLCLTKMVCRASGAYLGSSFSTSAFLEKEQEKIHMDQAEELIHAMRARGYFGYVSVDAIVAKSKPYIVEINARKTMGYVFYTVWKEHFSGKSFSATLCPYDPTQTTFLPRSMTKSDGSHWDFRYMLCLQET